MEVRGRDVLLVMKKAQSLVCQGFALGFPCWTRTNDPAVNSCRNGLRVSVEQKNNFFWCTIKDSNLGPTGYENITFVQSKQFFLEISIKTIA